MPVIRVAHDVLPQERQQRILAQLQRDGRVVASDLAASFGVSEDSVRRDLREMAAAGMCRRVYGGALLPTPAFPPLAERVARADAQRSALARHAAGLVQVGQSVLLDAGSTNVDVARALAGRAVRVITNAPAVAAVLAGDALVTLVMIGGRIAPACGGAIGAVAIQQLAGLQADLCMPGTCAIEPDTGAWGLDGEEVAFKQAMARASAATVIVATDAKVGAQGHCHLLGMSAIDHLVLGNRIDPDLVHRFGAGDTQVHRVASA